MGGAAHPTDRDVVRKSESLLSHSFQLDSISRSPLSIPRPPPSLLM